MDVRQEIDRRINELKIELTQKMHDELNKLRFGMWDQTAARWVVLLATLEELTDEQRDRIKIRAEELAGSPAVKEEVAALLSPSDDD